MTIWSTTRYKLSTSLLESRFHSQVGFSERFNFSAKLQNFDNILHTFTSAFFLVLSELESQSFVDFDLFHCVKENYYCCCCRRCCCYVIQLCFIVIVTIITNYYDHYSKRMAINELCLSLCESQTWRVLAWNQDSPVQSLMFHIKVDSSLYLRSRSRRHRESPGSALCRFKRTLRRSVLWTEVPEVTTNAR